MNTQNTNWGQSVAAVVIREDRVLLARHTYGGGKGLLIIPGGYVEHGETPQEAVIRELKEETGVMIEPREIIGIRFNMHDWYTAFRGQYISGEARPDGDENDEVLWLPVEQALSRDDVPQLTKSLIQSALSGRGLEALDYAGGNPPCSLYGFAENGKDAAEQQQP